MTEPAAWTLWDDERFLVSTPGNPHLPATEGCHLLTAPKDPPPAAWSDPSLTAATFGIAAVVADVVVRLGIADWVNLQANGNWGLLPGAQPHFHVHVYGRLRTGTTWARPVVLPPEPGAFGFPPLGEAQRRALIEALAVALG